MVWLTRLHLGIHVISIQNTFTYSNDLTNNSSSVAHCSRSQDIESDLLKFQLSCCYNPLQDTCPITSAILGHLIGIHVPLIFLDRNKSYWLSEKCATLLKWNLLELKRDLSFQQHQLCRWLGNKLTPGLMLDKERVPRNVVTKIMIRWWMTIHHLICFIMQESFEMIGNL